MSTALASPGCNWAPCCWLWLGQDFTTAPFPAGGDHHGLLWRKLCHGPSSFPMKASGLRQLVSKKSRHSFPGLEGSRFPPFFPPLSCLWLLRAVRGITSTHLSLPFDYVRRSLHFPEAVTRTGMKYNCSPPSLSPRQAQTPAF